MKKSLFYSCFIYLGFIVGCRIGAVNVLHLSLHTGCLYDFEEVAREIGVGVTSWYLHDDTAPQGHLDGFSNHCAIYNIGHKKAEIIWERHKDYFDKFDVIMTSDTAPLSRIFLQNNWKKPLIIWVCNRFDYFDGSTYDGTFPDSEYYQLIKEATRKDNVRIISYTPYEWFYARHKGVDFGERTIKPIGILPKGDNGPESSPIPKEVNRSETLFFYPRQAPHQAQYIQSQCTAHGIKTYTGKYNGPDDLTSFKGILYFPYAWSNLALYENIQRGIVHFVPSEKFVLANKTKPIRYLTFNNFNFCEWYRDENRSWFVYFDSWDDLKRKIEETDYAQISARLKEDGKLHRQKMLMRWQDVFDELKSYWQ